MSKIIILFICALLKVVSQVNVPNGDFNQFETTRNNNYSYDLPIGWKEHRKNNAWRLENGNGFAYKYNLPDANGNALALYRGSATSHITEQNSIFSSFSVSENNKNLRLVGRYKFSGSDIEQTIDTLKVVVFSTSKELKKIPDIFPKDAAVLDLVVTAPQFEWFHLDISKIEMSNYLTIVIQLKSGSDDNYYWGYSNAVIDDLKFVQNQKTVSLN